MGPLTGVKVIEMASLAPGPFAAMMLADLGAEVLRVDRPTPSDVALPVEIEAMNRNRGTIKIDMKSPKGLAALKRLIGQADALIESFRPGVMERLGVGPEECLKLNPKLVFGRVTGWGQEGPLAHAAGHDLNYIALTGALHEMGKKGEPPPIPLNLVGDYAGGGMMLAFGIVCALLEARASGKGQVVDAAMIDGASLMITQAYGLRGHKLWPEERGQTVLNGASHFYNVYETADGKYVSIASAERKFYEEMLRLTGVNENELTGQLDQAGWPALHERFKTLFRTKTRAEWCALMEGSDACFAPVLSMAEAVAHPHNKARAAHVDVGGVMQPAPAPRFSRTPAGAPTPGRALTDDQDGALSRWGLNAEEIASLRETGAVG